MDINLARTFLTVAETGSFIDAAQRLNITQSTVSARIKGLEDLLGRPVFERSKTGADLTEAGEQFHKHALALVRVWQRAQLDVSLSQQHRNHIALGAPSALWNGFLLRCVTNVRKELPNIAITGTSCFPNILTQKLVEGDLDLAVMYRPFQPPGHAIEHLFDEEFVFVSSANREPSEKCNNYIFVNWGPDFQVDHTAAYPELVNSGLALDLGTLSVDYIIDNGLSAYFPLRIVKPYLSRGLLRQGKNARRFLYPVYLVYPESRDDEDYEAIIDLIKREGANS
ncbi:MAG: LysR family transcriptional regulator [Hyphomicrobium sp.]